MEINRARLQDYREKMMLHSYAPWQLINALKVMFLGSAGEDLRSFQEYLEILGLKQLDPKKMAAKQEAKKKAVKEERLKALEKANRINKQVEAKGFTTHKSRKPGRIF